MKKLLAVMALMVVALTGGSLARPAAAMASADGGKSAMLGQGELHNGLYAKVANEVELDGTVDGDVIVLANKFTLKGTVNGSVYVLAQNAVIEGTVSGNVHVLAGDVAFAAQAHSLYAAASSFVSSKQMHLSGTLAVAASSADIAGQVDQSAYVAGSEVRYDAPTTGSVKVAAADISIGSSAVIGGNLSYSDSAQLTMANDKNIAGSINKFASPRAEQTGWASILSKVVFGLLAAFVLGATMLWLLPGSVVATSAQLRSRPGRSLLAGFGFVVAVPFAALALVLTAVGFELAIISIMAYIAVLMVGSIFSALLVGRQLLGTKLGSVSLRTNALPLLVGLLILGLLSVLPGVGGLISFAAAIGGIGALVTRSWERMRLARKAQLSA